MLAESQATLLLSPPHNIAQLLSSESLLFPATDLKLKHGVIGLLKHLSQASVQSVLNRTALSNAGIIERIVASGVWDDRGDVMADIVQVNAIGVVKHLCNNSSRSSLLAQPFLFLTILRPKSTIHSLSYYPRMVQPPPK